MKLYTEEQVKNFLKERTFMTEDAIDKLCAPLIPIELPSDEYIDEVFQPMTELNAFYKDGFINGAKWIKEQIIGLETNNIEEPK